MPCQAMPLIYLMSLHLLERKDCHHSLPANAKFVCKGWYGPPTRGNGSRAVNTTQECLNCIFDAQQTEQHLQCKHLQYLDLLSAAPTSAMLLSARTSEGRVSLQEKCAQVQWTIAGGQHFIDPQMLTCWGPCSAACTSNSCCGLTGASPCT